MTWPSEETSSSGFGRGLNANAIQHILAERQPTAAFRHAEAQMCCLWRVTHPGVPNVLEPFITEVWEVTRIGINRRGVPVQ
jgi:hypothetical protein